LTGPFNNLVPGQNNFGQADLVFPRLLTPVFKDLAGQPGCQSHDQYVRQL
jgi:hypothetical protein